MHLALASVLTSPFALYAAPGENIKGRWGTQFNWPIIPIHAVLLPQGKVLTFGTDSKGKQGAQFNYDIWDPGKGTGKNSHQSLPNKISTDIFCAATGLLPNGDVLIPGGDTRNPSNAGIKATSIYRQGKQTLEATDEMNFARWYPTVTTLPNGESLVHGGIDGGKAPVAAPEIFSKGSWRTVWGAANAEIVNKEARWFYPRNFVAPDGRLFGMSGGIMYYLDWQGDGDAEIVGNLPKRSRSSTSTAVMFEPGKILQVGGKDTGSSGDLGSNKAIMVDITEGSPEVSNLADMAFKREWANATVLPDGQVFISGGSAKKNELVNPATTAELWNPKTRKFTQLAKAATARLYHSSALLLPDATVLVGGGGAPGPLTNLNAEIYYPPYLFDSAGNFAKRLKIDEVAAEQRYGRVTEVQFSGAGTVKRVTLVRTGAVTHSFDMSQRFLELEFTKENGAVSVAMPDSSHIAPPGYYMLYLVNDKGVPSVSKIIRLVN
ncbi:MAG TPA: galactose oxidase-like domain-containing protein [Oligoflexus sp.]|uniref:galactose oxidase-like domain-containing protein n=1 Tax=Oligoflexus sp. TaxID=1971216 RepID=UPI002D318410|nr:galactose oxidase-like domain-containing protein [Oligoflexus sp.]HYX33499.1 galactose oxidase-like domain-containing protein [Oligoflexus sp.]